MPTIVLLRLAAEERLRRLEAVVGVLPRRALPRAVRSDTMLVLGVVPLTGAAAGAPHSTPHGGVRQQDYAHQRREIVLGLGNHGDEGIGLTHIGVTNP